MIVKNEEAVIERCLSSVKPLISSWSIVDTGSTDKTKEIIRETLKDIPGELHERPWQNFAFNRTECIQLAVGKADYDLVIDADDVLAVPADFKLPELTHDTYELKVEDMNIVYYRPHIFKNDGSFRYESVIHEYLTRDEPQTKDRLNDVVYRRIGGGARGRSPDTYRKDAMVLKRALQKEPNNARYVFYLAQSYKDAGDLIKAMSAYERRASMTNGFYEEVYISLLEIARLKQLTGATEREIIAAFLRAYEYRPQRIESLYHLANYFRLKDRFVLGYLYAKAALGTPLPPDVLFVDYSVYEWRIIDEFAISAYYIGEIAQSRVANEKLLASPHLPPEERPRIEENLTFCILQRSA